MNITKHKMRIVKSKKILYETIKIGICWTEHAEDITIIKNISKNSLISLDINEGLLTV